MWWCLPASATPGPLPTRIQLVGVPEVPVHELILPVVLPDDARPDESGQLQFTDVDGEVLPYQGERVWSMGEVVWWVRLPNATPAAAVWSWPSGGAPVHPWQPYVWVHHLNGLWAARGERLSGVEELGPGRFGQAARLDGQSVSLEPLAAFTLTAWVRADPDLTAPLLAYPTWQVTVDPLGSPAFDVGGAHLSAATPIDDGEWHHLGLTYRLGHAALYVDGAREASGPADQSVVVDPYAALVFGRGWWDEVRIAPLAHTPEWVAADAAIDGALAYCNAGTAPLRWRVDGDGDGVFGPAFEGCDPPSAAYVLDDGSVVDCDDADPRRTPGADEGHGRVDRDCDGVAYLPTLGGGCATAPGGWWWAALAVWWRRGAPRDPVAPAPARLP